MRRRTLILWVALILFSQNCLADDSEKILSVEIGDAYHIKDNDLDRSVGEFSKDESYNLLYVSPSLSWSPQPWLGMYASAYASWRNPISDPDDDAIEADLTAAYIYFDNPSLYLALGKQSVQLGRGLILGDDSLAANLNWHWDQTYIDVKAARVLDASPVAAIEFGYWPGKYEHIAIFGAWLQDRDDILAKSLPLDDAESDGNLYWVGLSGKVFWGPVQVSAVGAYQTGQLSARATLPIVDRRVEQEFDVSAYFFDVAIEGNPMDWFSLGAFCYMASGDRDPLRGDITAHTTLLAYAPRMTIFFDSGFLDRDSSDEYTFGGAVANGVIAPGITMSLEPLDSVSIEASAATFYAHEDLSDGERWYGYEIDLGVSYAFLDHFEIFAHAARFVHGDFFKARLGSDPDPATRFTFGGLMYY